MWTRLGEIERMFNAMDRLHNKMNRLYSDYGRTPAFSSTWGMPQSGPSTNLFDCGDHLEMQVEVPGIAREDLSIRVQGNYLEIRGSRKAAAPEGYTAQRVERGATEFTRSFTLSSEVDTGKVEAQLANGILRLTLPKAETAKPKRISIK